ncbi:D-alanyl-D-alanine carboxypeptidase/D-alanyl-D-alanine-endopeptidase [Arthrobacter sp. TMP15]|uniref:D-alanyl-D-alanine carboxypeptidase/D-alanyl-D-alanine endopeptidase n=1 Tax=Arthrobacter sp. TMP15 TaxID=3140789 RepID=UPI0031BA4A24
MGRTSKVVTSGLLVCALAAVSVPVGLQVIPAFFPLDPGSVVVLPAAQQAPTSLGEISGVSPLAATAPIPDPGALSAGLKKALMFDGEGTFSMYVTDALTGETLFSQDGEKARTPASNLKLLTAGAVLKTLGPSTQFSTQAIAGSKANEIVLLAGGDSLLTAGASRADSTMGHAGLATLAQQTAKTLATAGVTGPATLSIDDTLFTGPALNPKWGDGDVEVGEIAPIFPMALYAGRYIPGVLSGPRPQDSAVAVAEAFAQALEDAGVKTTGAITRGKAPPPADGAGTNQPGAVLGTVKSASVTEQVRYMLEESDNYVAEVLGRMTAAKLGKEASNSGAVAAVRQVVQELGLEMTGISITDNSGLAAGNLISSQQLVQMLSLMLADPAAEIGQALPGLPIAGLTGSLAHRFVSAPSLDGAGLVRAKTGSLNLVTSLSGYVVNSQGRILVFSMMANGLTGGPIPARSVVDRAASVLASS